MKRPAGSTRGAWEEPDWSRGAASAEEPGADDRDAAADDDGPLRPPAGGAPGCLAALLENRAREVGLAVLDLERGRLHLHALIEPGRGYEGTLDLLKLHAPGLLLLCTNSLEGRGGLAGLADALAAHPARKVAAGRGAFDDSQGILLLRALGARDPGLGGFLDSTQLLKAYYLALGSAAAVLGHAEHTLGYGFAPAALRIEFAGPGAKHASMDSATVRALELIEPCGIGSSGGGGGGCGRPKGPSLFSLLNGTRTAGGARLLRTSLLQPLRDIPALEARLDGVEELLAAPDRCAAISSALLQLPRDLDRILGRFVVRAKSMAAAVSGGRGGTDPTLRIAGLLDAVLQLRTALEAVPALRAALVGATSAPLASARDGPLAHPAFAELRARLVETLDDDLTAGRAAFVRRTQQLFAVRPGLDSLLDTARSTFCEVTEAIHALADRLRTSAGHPPALRLQYGGRRGFFLEIPSTGAPPLVELRALGYLQLERKGRALVASTAELHSLNLRLAGAQADCYACSEAVLEGLFAAVQQRLGPLSALAEAASLLDLLTNAFARHVAAAPGPYTRPQFTPDGPLAIDGGRHPVLECALRKLAGGDVVPNNCFLSDAAGFCILTGPNASGKSTYLRTVAVLVILAQAGCLVPCRYLSLRPVDSILTRVGTGDATEAGASSFLLEMREMAFIAAHATRRSLVLIDELGRATSTADGLALAWACAEFLILLGARAILATHERRLTALAALYPNARPCFLEVVPRGATDAGGAAAAGAAGGLDFTFLLSEGQDAVSNYGLTLAATAGLPPDVMARAAELAAELERREAALQAAAAGGGAGAGAGGEAAARALHGCYALAQRVLCLRYAAADMREPELRAYLRPLCQAARALGLGPQD